LCADVANDERACPVWRIHQIEQVGSILVQILSNIYCSCAKPVIKVEPLVPDGRFCCISLEASGCLADLEEEDEVFEEET
jgi:hypothetical protein